MLHSVERSFSNMVVKSKPSNHKRKISKNLIWTLFQETTTTFNQWQVDLHETSCPLSTDMSNVSIIKLQIRWLTLT